MKRHTAAVAVWFAALAIACGAIPAFAKLSRARDLFRTGAYDRARQEITADTASLKGTSLDEAILMLARLETDVPKAESLYRRAIASEDERTSQRARIELAKIQYASGDYQGAVETLTAQPPCGTEDDRNEAIYFTGLSRAQLGDARAAGDFERVTREPYAAWSLLARAAIDAQAGRLPAAVEKYERLQKSGPTPVALFKLGECYETLGERDKALARYRSLVDQYPRSLEAVKGKEKIALLGATKDRPKEESPAGGGESGERRAAGPRTTEAATRGFTIQFGSFEAKANALAVSAKLEKSFRGVRVESVEMEGRVWHRVRAGFYESRDAADRDAARAKSELGLTGTVIPLK